MRSPTIREAFGLRIAASPPIPAARPSNSRQPLVRIVRAPEDGREPRAGEPLWAPVIDGERVQVARGADSGLRITFGRHGTFAIAPDAGTISCRPTADVDAVRWRRFLLDTVLWCTALLHGHVELHAGAVASALGAVAIMAPSGGGKSSLVAELVHRGGRLITDDVLVITAEDVPLAHPGPAVMTLDARTDGAPVRAIGRSLGTLGAERWLEVDRRVCAPVPLSAVVLLERDGDSRSVVLEPADAPFLRLMAHTIALPGLPRAFVRRRFEVLADLVGRVPVFTLRVPASLPPAAIAERLEHALGAEGAPDLHRS